MYRDVALGAHSARVLPVKGRWRQPEGGLVTLIANERNIRFHEQMRGHRAMRLVARRAPLGLRRDVRKNERPFFLKVTFSAGEVAGARQLHPVRRPVRAVAIAAAHEPLVHRVPYRQRELTAFVLMTLVAKTRLRLGEREFHRQRLMRVVTGRAAHADADVLAHLKMLLRLHLRMAGVALLRGVGGRCIPERDDRFAESRLLRPGHLDVGRSRPVTSFTTYVEVILNLEGPFPLGSIKASVGAGQIRIGLLRVTFLAQVGTHVLGLLGLIERGSRWRARRGSGSNRVSASDRCCRGRLSNQLSSPERSGFHRALATSRQPRRASSRHPR